MADETGNQTNTDKEEQEHLTSESDLEEAKVELMAAVDGASDERTDSASSSSESLEETEGLSELSDGAIELTETAVQEEVAEASEDVEASENGNLDQGTDSDQGSETSDVTPSSDETMGSAEVTFSEEIPTKIESDLDTETNSSNSDVQAVIALKADSRLYIYGEPEDPMVGVTQNIDRARDLMLETMAKSRATTADSVQKARNLNFISGLFLCSALLAAVGFFVFMSIQMSQKIVEIDSLLTAVAKRSIQMTKGIEKFSVIEEQLEKTLGNQDTISDYLAQDGPYRSQLNNRIEELRSQLKKDMSARVLRSEGNLNEILDGVAASAANNEQGIKQITSMVKNQGDPSKAIQDLKRSLREIEDKLNDLYLIEQARLSREIAAQRNREVGFETRNGLD